MDRMDEKMKKIFLASIAILLLSSCASFKKYFCDCNQSSNKENKSSTAEHTPKTSSNKEAGIVVDSADIEMGNRMSRAIDAYVFKNEKEDFTTLCNDNHFDCYLNEKRFPKDRKKIKRKVPPFTSGSKMGLQGETRIRLKYDFYP